MIWCSQLQVTLFLVLTWLPPPPPSSSSPSPPPCVSGAPSASPPWLCAGLPGRPAASPASPSAPDEATGCATRQRDTKDTASLQTRCCDQTQKHDCMQASNKTAERIVSKLVSTCGVGLKKRSIWCKTVQRQSFQTCRTDVKESAHKLANTQMCRLSIQYVCVLPSGCILFIQKTQARNSTERK